MRRVGFLLVLLVSAAAVTLSAQTKRTFTNPRPEPYFKTLFPNAGGFSSFGGTPLHYKVYGVDPKTNPSAPPIGLVFWTTDLVPEEHGYHGPIHIIVGLDMTGIITGAFVDYQSEPYGYFSVEPPEFAAQFKGKSVRAPFKVGEDVHAVSRATISITSGTRAVRDSVRTMAKLFLNPASVKN